MKEIMVEVMIEIMMEMIGNDDGNIGNDNSSDRYEGSRTSKHTGKGKRSYPKTMFKRKF